ncbi:MAG: glutathione peroxidase [Gammaproteobacteria bacterium]|nr:MAG: glutathione peroxidase [Gammaproteobacteria bacterium]
MNLHDFSVKTIDGQALNLGDYTGQAVLLVNVASECGLTPQYAGLEKLHEAYSDSGLVVLGLPCNQFGGQEPGAEPQIKAFCESNYQITFPMTARIEVNGDGADPLYQWLTGSESPFPGDITWNFEKFIVDRDGLIAARFDPKTEPDDPGLKEAIEAALNVEL